MKKDPEETNEPELENEPELQQEEEVETSEIEELRGQAKEFKHKYLQQLAEMENSRKRLQKERGEIVKFAIENVICDFLHPIDHMENALRHTEQASDDVKHWAVGFQMILNQFKDVLANNGVKPMETVGKEFDPHFHEAIEMITTTEQPAGTIVEESLRGYLMGDKTIRPAKVKVAKTPAESAEEKINKHNQGE